VLIGFHPSLARFVSGMKYIAHNISVHSTPLSCDKSDGLKGITPLQPTKPEQETKISFKANLIGLRNTSFAAWQRYCAVKGILFLGL
jgi:hypothetical protein